MFRSPRLVLFLAAFVLTLPIIAAPTPAPSQTTESGNLLKLLPKETDLVFVIRDMSDLKRKIAGSPMATIWNHPGVHQYVEQFGKEIEKNLREFHKGTGIKLEDLLSVFDGQMLFAVSDLKEYLARAKDCIKNKKEFEEVGLPNMCLIAETRAKGGEATGYVKTLLSKGVEADKKFYVKKDDFRGVEITAFGDEQVPLYHVQVPNMLVFTSTRTSAERLIAAHTKGGGESIADKADFQQAMRKVGTSNDVALYMDFTCVPDVVDVIVTAAIGGRGMPIPGIDSLVKGIVNEICGLDCLRSYTFGIKLDGAGLSCNAFIATKGEAKGMVSLIRGKSEKIVPTSIPKEATYFGIFNLEVGPFWTALEKTISEFMKSQAEANPDFPAMNPFDMVEMMFGVDIKEDIIDNIGSTVTFYMLPVASAPEGKRRWQQRTMFEMGVFGRAVFLVALKDEAKLSAVMNKLLSRPDAGGEVEKEEYMGKTIYKDKGAGDQAPAFGIVNGQFAVAMKLDDLKGYIRRAGKAVESIAETDDYRQMAPWVPATCSGLLYCDSRYYHQSMQDNLEVWRQLFAKRGSADDIDLTKLPDEEFWKGLIVGMVGTIVPESDGIFSASYLKFRTGGIRK